MKTKTVPVGHRLSMITAGSILISALVIYIFNYYIDQLNIKTYQLILITAVMALVTVAVVTAAAYLMIRRISRPLKILAEKSNLLALGDTDIQIEEGCLKRNDEIGLMGLAFISIAENSKQHSEAAARIAGGDLSFKLTPKSDKDALGIGMISVVKTLKELVTEAESLTAAAVEGRLDARSNADKFNGGYQRIITGINHTMDAIAAPLNIASEYIQTMADGDKPESPGEFNGAYGVLIQNLVYMNNVMDTLYTETIELTKAFASGEISHRADANKLKGRYTQILYGMNESLDVVIAPLYTAAGYLEKIGKGEIPERVQVEYNGEFDSLKNSINACIDGLGALVECNRILLKMGAENDYSEMVEGEYSGIYNEIKDSLNGAIDVTREVIGTFDKISKGDLTDLDYLNGLIAQGIITENDMLVPVTIKTLETIKMLSDEVKVLSAAAVEGKLSTRGDADKFEGVYANTIRGFNDTLDAVIAPIKEAADILQEMAKGNLQIVMEGDYRGDHAMIKSAMNETIKNLRSYISEISSVLEAIGEGNLNVAITAEYKGDFVEIKDSLNSIVTSLSRVLGEINDAAEQVASGSRQVSDGSQALSQGSTEQSSAIRQLTASIAEVDYQTRQNAVNANKASKLAGNARVNAEKGTNQMREMLNSMAEINDSSSNISKIIKVIDDIAFQTNILALNAAVEAARAGQHGKGFAVVAEEVRNLAARSSAAARETTELIECSINKVEIGTKIANETASALLEIVESIEKSANLAGGIADASNDQASGIDQITKGIEQVSQIVQNNSASAEESAATSEELSGQAELLKEMVGQFRINRSMSSLIGETTRLLGGRIVGVEFGEKDSWQPKIQLGDEELDKY